MNDLFLALSIVSVVGIVVGVVLLLKGLANKDSKINPPKSALIILISFVVFFVGMYGFTETIPPLDWAAIERRTAERTQEEKTVVLTNFFDDLQNLFISLTFETTAEELEVMIAEKGLSYSSQVYNPDNSITTYKIAYTKGATAHSHADRGDYVKISFDRKNGNSFMFAEYVNANHRGCALYYNYGIWYSFRKNNAEDYSGYYYIDMLGGASGIVIKYTNGNKVKTHYHKCRSAVEAIGKILSQ